jgi:hypothetical protein
MRINIVCFLGKESHKALDKQINSNGTRTGTVPSFYFLLGCLTGTGTIGQ